MMTDTYVYYRQTNTMVQTNIMVAGGAREGHSPPAHLLQNLNIFFE